MERRGRRLALHDGGVGSGVGGGQRGGGGADLFAQGGGFDDLGGGAPAEDPAFDLGERAEAETKFHGAAGKFAHLLRCVPFAFADEVGGFRFEANDHEEVSVAAEDAERVGEKRLGVEVGGFFECGGCDDETADPRQREREGFAAVEIVGDEIPQVFTIRQVVGTHATTFGLRGAGLAVVELYFVEPKDGAAQGVEGREIGFGDAHVFEGNGAQLVGGREGDFVAKTAGKFFEGDFELTMEGGAAVLFEGALGDEEREQFALGYLDGGKGVDRVRVTVGLNRRVILDGQVETVAHEGDVADDGFSANLQARDQLGAVHQGAAPKFVVDTKHAFEGRAGELCARGHRQEAEKSRQILYGGTSNVPSGRYDGRMKTRLSRSKMIGLGRTVRIGPSPRVSKAPSSRPAAVEPAWSHLGALYRITVWPDAQLERLDGEQWTAAAPEEEVLASGMLQIEASVWRRYLEFLPAAERAFVSKFRYGRLAALLMIARCPELLADLDETPALVAFLAAHASLRGTEGPRWDEVAAVHGRAGVFGVLEWLGLPASRPALTVLRNLIDPDVPRRLLEPLRSLLWQPVASSMLQRVTELTDRELARYCHALAA